MEFVFAQKKVLERKGFGQGSVENCVLKTMRYIKIMK